MTNAEAAPRQSSKPLESAMPASSRWRSGTRRPSSRRSDRRCNLPQRYRTGVPRDGPLEAFAAVAWPASRAVSASVPNLPAISPGNDRSRSSASQCKPYPAPRSSTAAIFSSVALFSLGTRQIEKAKVQPLARSTTMRPERRSYRADAARGSCICAVRPRFRAASISASEISTMDIAPLLQIGGL